MREAGERLKELPLAAAQGRLAEVETELRAAIAAGEGVLDPAPLAHARAVLAKELVKALLGLGRTVEAEQAAERLLARQRSRYGRAHHEVVEAEKLLRQTREQGGEAT